MVKNIDAGRKQPGGDRGKMSKKVSPNREWKENSKNLYCKQLWPVSNAQAIPVDGDTVEIHAGALSK
jgi:hypothetical protein